MDPQEIREALQKKFSPTILELIDKSHTHTPDQHVESMKSRQKLYDLLIVSEAFKGKGLVERHQAVYEALGEGMKTTIHGISIKAHTPEEWAQRQRR